MNSRIALFATSLVIALFGFLPVNGQAADEQKAASCCAQQAACCAPAAGCCDAGVQRKDSQNSKTSAAQGCCAPGAACCEAGAACCQ